MNNLAGSNKASKEVASELELAGIPAITNNDGWRNEVSTNVQGLLGGFHFSRAWKYWVVSGNVPLVVAQKLYENDLGKKDIRVAGHCGCPPPENPWLLWQTADGKKLVSSGEEDEFDLFIKSGYLDPSVKDGIIFANIEDFPKLGEAYVDLYHIDSQAGLNLFVETLKAHHLVNSDPL